MVSRKKVGSNNLWSNYLGSKKVVSYEVGAIKVHNNKFGSNKVISYKVACDKVVSQSLADTLALFQYRKTNPELSQSEHPLLFHFFSMQ